MGNVLFPLSFLFGGDKRSYLYPGKNKSQLTPEEQQLEKLYDDLDRPGHRVSPQEFFKTPEYARFLDTQYGDITQNVPPGSKIISQNSFKVEYEDPDGYRHVLTRKPNSQGRVEENTNRPAIPVNKGQQDFAQQLQGLLQQGIGQPATLAQLDPQTAAALQAISTNEQSTNDQQLQDLQQQLIARLYGNNVNKSSIANEAAGRFAEGAGRVRQAQQSDAANREIAVRNLLTTLGQQNRELQAGLYSNITGQQNQSAIAGAGLDLEKLKLGESGRQFDANNKINELLAQLEQEKFKQSNSPLNQISRLLGVGQQAAGLAGGGISAYRALTGGR
jgi:hypothetical protein